MNGKGSAHRKEWRADIERLYVQEKLVKKNKLWVGVISSGFVVWAIYLATELQVAGIENLGWINAVVFLLCWFLGNISGEYKTELEHVENKIRSLEMSISASHYEGAD